MRTLIIPGWYGSGPGHWQSWWLATDQEARLVEQADWAHPSVDSWVKAAARAAEDRPGSVLVSHSLGGALVAHLAQRYPGLPIAGALIVAPADVDDRSWTSPELASFAPVPTRRLGFRSIVVASRNDPYVSFARASALAAHWGAEIVDAGDAGHINADSGFGPWPEGRSLAERIAHGRGPENLAGEFVPAPPARERREHAFAEDLG